VDNTVDDPQETIGHTVVYDVNAWQAYIVERHRLKGTFLENLELFHFPFDTQVLETRTTKREIRYDAIDELTCAQKLTSSRLDLPHGTVNR